MKQLLFDLLQLVQYTCVVLLIANAKNKTTNDFRINFLTQFNFRLEFFFKHLLNHAENDRVDALACAAADAQRPAKRFGS